MSAEEFKNEAVEEGVNGEVQPEESQNGGIQSEEPLAGEINEPTEEVPGMAKEELPEEKKNHEPAQSNNTGGWQAGAQHEAGGTQTEISPKSKMPLYIGVAVGIVLIIAIIAMIVVNNKGSQGSNATENTTTVATVTDATTPAVPTEAAAQNVDTPVTVTEGTIEITPAPAIATNPSTDGADLPLVATLSSETISQQEFRYFLNYFKTNMLMETGIEPGSPDEAEFWSQDMGDGNKIIDYAKMSALDELENLKVCTAEARNRGIVLDAEDMENINTDLQAQMDSVGGEEALVDLLGTTFGITFSDYSNMYGEFMLQNKLVIEELDSIPVSEEEIKEYYDQNAELYTSVTVRHILYLFEGDDPDTIRTEEESKALAEEMLKRVENGEDMKALAEEFSEDTGVTVNSGEYTFKRTDSFVPEFLDWGFASEIGESGIIETSYGYHVMKKEGIVVEALEDVTETINTTIKNGKMDIIFDGWKADPKNVLVLNQEVFDSIE